jgi:heavy metal sensor kinase
MTAFPARIIFGLPIRWRLSIWYCAVLVVILTACGAAVYGLMGSHLARRTDAALGDELTEVQDEITHARTREDLQRRLEQRFGEDVNNEYQVMDDQDVLVFRSRRLGAQPLPLPSGLDSTSSQAATVTLHGHQNWRVASRLLKVPEGTLRAQVATSLQPDEDDLHSLLSIMLIAGPIALAGALAGGYLLARHALAPVDRMVATASEITVARLDRRLNVGHSTDELSRLAQTMNKMIERLDRSFRDMRRFTGDAAHELRTPLAIIRNAAEVGLAEPEVPAECRRALEDILEEATRLGGLADQLLYLTREDSGIESVVYAVVRLDALAVDVIDHMRLVAEEKGILIRAVVPLPTSVNGDADRLRRLLLNLLDNAIKFTPAGGQVELTIEHVDGAALVRIRDTGVGISAEHFTRIFERFYRVDPARESTQGGAGLGLAICKAIVQLHGGEIEAESAPGQGTCIRFRLPLTEPAAGGQTQPNGS